MSEQPKPTDAEDILSEFNKDSQPEEKPVVEQPEEKPVVEQPEEKTGEKTTQIKESDQPRDIIFVGKKPLMTYVNATLTQLSVSPVVTIKSRGKSITQAVDISQFILKRMDTVGYFVKDVRISSDSLKSNDGKSRNVSTIEIDMSHK
tara:strand:+ start:370 stop:810 length:441 start_codon:yes stop_codon:yes gene_type:complete